MQMQIVNKNLLFLADTLQPTSQYLFPPHAEDIKLD
jgi:hypothetical protein